MSDGEAERLLRRHAELLFRLDSSGRLISTNEPEPEPAPRAFLCRGRESSLAWYRHDVDAGTIKNCTDVVARLPGFDGRPGPSSLFEPLRVALRLVQPIDHVAAGPAFSFGEPVEVDGAEEVREIDAGSSGLLERYFPYTRAFLEARKPVVGVVIDGVVVSACYSARRDGHACEAGVATEEAYRGRGLAARVVAAWRDAVEHEGLTPLYSTSWDNAASLAVARKLRLEPYAETVSIT